MAPSMTPQVRLRTTPILLLTLAACQQLAAVEGLTPGSEQRRYACSFAADPPVIDGRLDDACWRQAEWTDEFVDIQGRDRPLPRFSTRARMLWDDQYFYVAAWLEEPHVFATLEQRDSVIFNDNDFEVFLDPDGDSRLYTELEINALGTEWDLLLVQPYRDGGPALNGFDLSGLKSAVQVQGTLNDPSDIDRGWSVEIAFPWSALKETSRSSLPPAPGDTWRVNFSRVEWHTRVLEGSYVKATDPLTDQTLPEDNWVWSPQGVINMHHPEAWGWVRFERPTLPAPGAGRRDR